MGPRSQRQHFQVYHIPLCIVSEQMHCMCWQDLRFGRRIAAVPASLPWTASLAVLWCTACLLYIVVLLSSYRYCLPWTASLAAQCASYRSSSCRWWSARRSGSLHARLFLAQDISIRYEHVGGELGGPRACTLHTPRNRLQTKHQQHHRPQGHKEG